jgi:predicted DNA-binding protein
MQNRQARNFSSVLGRLALQWFFTMLAMTSRKPLQPAVRQVNFRLPQDSWEWLAAAAGVLGRPHSSIVAEALQQYRTALPVADQQLIEQTIARRRQP